MKQITDLHNKALYLHPYGIVVRSLGADEFNPHAPDWRKTAAGGEFDLPVPDVVAPKQPQPAEASTSVGADQDALPKEPMTRTQLLYLCAACGLSGLLVFSFGSLIGRAAGWW